MKQIPAKLCATKKTALSFFLFIMVTCGSCLFSSYLFADAPKEWQIWYQDPASPVMERINDMHIGLMWLITSILVVVTALLVYAMFRFRASKNPTPSKTTHNVPLEILWTMVPVLIVAAIAYPSIKLIYYMDKTEDPFMTLKVIGHQWYWEYDYPDHNVSFDSFMLNKDQLQPGQLRNLEVDKRVVVPVGQNIRVLTTSADVLHSFAVPALGVKQDTIPGRLRETWMRINKPGVYYGQCSELCGSGHGFMSIAIEAVPLADFEAWVQKEGGALPSTDTKEENSETILDSNEDPNANSSKENATQGVQDTSSEANQSELSSQPSSEPPSEPSSLKNDSEGDADPVAQPASN